jgi:glycosyltransferase involved in cell wall biosynthesis
MTKPLVSVLITAYNYGRFIEEAINSVLSQDFPLAQVEVVVVDDGSTDDTAERVKKYGSKINYFHKPNGGQASALNLGFAKARGEIISLLDADDYFFPNKLARLAEIFAGDPALGMVYHPFLEFDMETGERRVSKFPAMISGSAFEDPEKFVRYAGPGTCASFRRSFLERLLPIPESIRMLADGYLGSLIVFVAPILAVPECLAAYRFHGKNSFHAEEGEMPSEMRKARLAMWRIVVPAMFKWLADNGYTRKQRPVRIFHDRWNLYLENQEFALKAPGRLRFFRFVLFEIYSAVPTQARKLTGFNYLAAPLALILGYQRAHLMYGWRAKALAKVEFIYRKVFGPRPGPARQKESNGRISP